MFRKSLAILLALWFPMTLSLQGCGQKSGTIDPLESSQRGSLGDLGKDACALKGDIDTDGDGICDGDERNAFGPDESDSPETDEDVNGDILIDGEQSKYVWHTDWGHWIALTGGLIAGWGVRGVAQEDGFFWSSDGNTARNAANSVDGATFTFGNPDDGRSTLKTWRTTQGKSMMTLDTWVISGEKIQILNQKFGKGARVCFTAPFVEIPGTVQETNSSEGIAEIQLQIPDSPSTGKVLEDLETGTMDSLCSNRDPAVWIAVSNRSGTKWSAKNISPRLLGFRMVLDDDQKTAHEAKMVFKNLTGDAGPRTYFVSKEDSRITTKDYEIDKVDHASYTEEWANCEESQQSPVECKMRALLALQDEANLNPAPSEGEAEGSKSVSEMVALTHDDVDDPSY